jgi:hypothetical protein
VVMVKRVESIITLNVSVAQNNSRPLFLCFVDSHTGSADHVSARLMLSCCTCSNSALFRRPEAHGIRITASTCQNREEIGIVEEEQGV